MFTTIAVLTFRLLYSHASLISSDRLVTKNLAILVVIGQLMLISGGACPVLINSVRHL